MRELRRILKSTVIYLFGNVSTKLVTFLLIPIYTARISPADFGKYDVDANYAMLISSVIFLDVWSGIMRFMYDQKNDKDKYKVVYSGLLVFLASSVLYAVVFFLLKDVLDIRYQFLVFLYGLMICIQNLYGYVARALGHNIMYAVSGFVSTLINAGLNILLIVSLSMNYSALFISYIIGILVQCLILESKVKILINIKNIEISKKLTREIFMFSFPLCINSVCYWILTGYNKIVVYNKLDATQNGYFAIAMKFSLALNLVASCFSLAWQELAYSKTAEDEETFSFYSSATNVYFKLLFIGSGLLIPVIAIIFPYFVDASYLGAKNIIPIYILATAFSILSTFLGNILSAYKKNNVIFISTLASCIVNVIVVNFLIFKIGLQAATIAMFLGYIVNCYIRGLLLKKYCHLRFDFKQVLYVVPIIWFVIFVYGKYGMLANFGIILLVGIVGVIVFRKNLVSLYQYAKTNYIK